MQNSHVCVCVFWNIFSDVCKVFDRSKSVIFASRLWCFLLFSHVRKVHQGVQPEKCFILSSLYLTFTLRSAVWSLCLLTWNQLHNGASDIHIKTIHWFSNTDVVFNTLYLCPCLLGLYILIHVLRLNPFPCPPHLSLSSWITPSLNYTGNCYRAPLRCRGWLDIRMIIHTAHSSVRLGSLRRDCGNDLHAQIQHLVRFSPICRKA